jgi:hypothetical protein
MHREPGRPRYQAYLLRCWEVRRSNGVLETAWRFSLEDPHTGQHRHYPHFDALIAALQQELMGIPTQDAQPEDPQA